MSIRFKDLVNSVEDLSEGKYIKKEDAKFKEGDTVGHMFRHGGPNTTGTVKKVDNNGNHHVELHDRKDHEGKPVVVKFDHQGYSKKQYGSDYIVSHDKYKDAVREREEKHNKEKAAQEKANSEVGSPEHKKIINGFHKHYPDLNLDKLHHVSSTSNRDGTTTHHYETHLPIDGPTKHLFKSLKAEVRIHNNHGKHSGSLSYRYEHPGGGSNGHGIADIYHHEDGHHLVDNERNTKKLHEGAEELDLSDFSVEELQEFLVSEEYEQLDEISKKTLGSYIKKASDQKTHLSTIAGRASLAADHSKNQDEKEYNWRLSGKWNSKAIARDRGIKKAVDKLTKEETESLREGVNDYDKLKKKPLADRTPKDEAFLKANKPKNDNQKFAIHIKHEDGSVTKWNMKRTNKDPSPEDIAQEHLKHMQKMHDNYKMGSRAESIHKIHIKEESEIDSEIISEISKETKNEYVHKSFAQGNDLHKKLKTETDPEERAKISAKISKRNQGIIRAAKKLKEETSNDFSIEDFSIEELEEFLVSEEYEQLDELSKKTLGSYIEKAGHHRVRLAKKEDKLYKGADDVRNLTYVSDKETKDHLENTANNLKKSAIKVTHKSFRRAKGISLAVKKLTEEDLEEVNSEDKNLEESISTHNLDKAFRDPYRLSVDGMQGHELSSAIRNSSHEDKWHAKIHNVYGSSIGFDTAARRNSAKRVLASHFKKSKEE